MKYFWQQTYLPAGKQSWQANTAHFLVPKWLMLKRTWKGPVDSYEELSFTTKWAISCIIKKMLTEQLTTWHVKKKINPVIQQISCLFVYMYSVTTAA